MVRTFMSFADYEVNDMPVYKDKDRGTWYCSFYYLDWTGKRKRKCKRGFKTKKLAQQYERDFLYVPTQNQEMTLIQLYNKYIEDINGKYKENTLDTKINIFDNHILPYLADKKIADITPSDIRMWQNEIIKKNLSKTYQKTINNQMSAILNYAVKYHGLASNPCSIAGSMGKKKADEMKYWTQNEFNIFIDHVPEPNYHIAFMLLYYGGFRKGELYALTPSDIDDKNIAINVRRNAHWKNRKLVVTEPKTDEGRRTVTLPRTVYMELVRYINSLYKIEDDERIFDFGSNSTLNKYLDNKVEELSGKIEKIRIHDLRHSHAALCIDMDINIYLLSKRMGHKDIETTINTYGHLYPNKQVAFAEKLDQKIDIDDKIVSQ